MNDDIGKEVVSTFDSSLKTGGAGRNKFYTDSNGREFMERVLDYRPTWDLDVFEPVAGNYYPVTAAMYVKDEEARQQLSVLTDRGQAGASLRDGHIELMVHRRLLADDSRGVEEALNETTGGMSHYPSWERSGDGITVTGKHYLLLSELDTAMAEVRTMMDEVFAPVVPLFTTDKQAIKDSMNAAQQQPSAALTSSPLGLELPVNVHLMTLEARSDSELLVRLAHQFAVDEDASLSAPVEVDLFALLSPFRPVSATEMTLSANQALSEQLAGKIHWNEEGETGKAAPILAAVTASSADAKKASPSLLRKESVAQSTFPVTLSAMQIKTFIVQLTVKK